MKLHVGIISVIASLSLAIGANSECVNTWDADLNDPTIELCSISTESSNPCKTEYTYGGTTYRSCIINGPEKFPSCITTSDEWSRCIVPTDSVVYGVTTRKAGSFSQNGASIGGGTMLWITGERFATSSISTSPSVDTSNIVILTNEFSSYECEIHPDATTLTQITCFTPAMNEGTYLVQIIVEGNIIPIYQYTNIDNAKIVVSDKSTPRINEITPFSGIPGTFVEIKGDFKTFCFTRDVDECADDSGARITRVYVGGQQCQLIDRITSELYEDVTKSFMKCKLEKAEVGYFIASMLVTNEYGRSVTNPDIFYVAPNQKLYNFQSFAEIDSISPQLGSTEGGTRITITGKYLYTDDNVPAMIDIAGTPCEVVSFDMKNLTETKIVCVTAASISPPADNYGNRGVSLSTEDGAIAFDDLGTTPPSANAVNSVLNQASFTDMGNSDITAWMRGYLYPRVNSSYEFTVVTNGNAKLFISTDASMANKQSVADSSTTKGTIQLNADEYYYFEAVGSKSGGGLNLKVKAKLLDTHLTEKDSGFVQNEIQEIEITSTIIPEAYTITPGVGSLNASNDTTSMGEAQSIVIESIAGEAPFAFEFYGARSVLIEYGASAELVQAALNDMPILQPNHVQVTEELADDGVSKNYTVTFDANLGDVPNLAEALGYVNTTVVQLNSHSGLTTMSQVVIDDVPSDLFDVVNGEEKDVQSAIERSFGIRCPASIQMNNEQESFETFDYEDCEWNVQSINENAYCGKCASRSDYFFRNLNSTLDYQHLCFAYKLAQPVTLLRLQIVDPLFKTISTIYSRLTLTADNQWHYTCQDLQATYDASNPTMNYPLNSIKVYSASVYPRSLDMYFDVVSVRKSFPLGVTSNTNMNQLNARRIMPTRQYMFNTFEFSKTNVTMFAYRPTNCSANLPEFTLINSFTDGAPSIAQTTAASEPVTGMFSLSWDGQSLDNIAANTSESDMLVLLQSFLGFGSAKITRSGDCSGYKWNVKWMTGGDKQPISISGNTLSGNNVAITASSIQEGGASFNPLRDDFLSTYHSDPQVAVRINDIPVKCSNCSFEWSQAVTPIVNSIDNTSTNAIQIVGTGFDAVTPENNLVFIGDIPCQITSATETLIVCSAGENSIGVYSFRVIVKDKGLAVMNSDATASFEFTATSISPTSGSTGGRNVLSVNGTGFSASSKVTVDGVDCKVISSNYYLIRCTVPSSGTLSNKQVDVTVTDMSLTSTLSSAYLYDYGNTLSVTVTPTVLTVFGGEIVMAEGNNLPVFTSGVKFNDREVTIVSSNSTHLMLRSPAMEPGVYNLDIFIESVGMIKVNDQIEYQLSVSSFTPRVGSIRGGSVVNVYGQGFSTECSMNQVRFGSQRCKVLNCSNNWITCETSSAYVVHEITNDGADPYHGKGYAWSNTHLKINLGESVKWTWKPPVGITTVKYSVIQTADALSFEQAGFSSGEPKAIGSFTHQFNQPGVYHYTSGYVESTRQILFRGIVEVLSSMDKELEIDVQLNGISASKCEFPFEYNGVNYTQCTNTDAVFNWCSPTPVYDDVKIPCDPLAQPPTDSCPGTAINLGSCGVTEPSSPYMMKFTTCGGNLASITSLSAVNITYDTSLTISGTGFSNTQCDNEVFIGGRACVLTASSSTQLTCQLGKESGLYANFPYSLEVLIKGKGYALQTDDFQVMFVPKIDVVSPSTGSVAGGTEVVLVGDGFIPQSTVVFIGQTPYYQGRNAHINTTHIVLTTVSGAEAQLTMEIQVNNVQATCDSCVFGYVTAISPVFDSITPLSVNDTANFTIVGSMFGNDLDLVEVMIGDDVCLGISVNDTHIECSVDGVKAGNKLVQVKIRGIGFAQTDSNKYITSHLAVKTISPNSGSIHGGTLVTITGNGFSSNTRIAIASYPCIIVNVNSRELKCLTTDSTGTPVSTLPPPTTTVPTTTVPTTTTAFVNQCLAEFRAASLLAHNTYRALHTSPDLVQNSEHDLVAQTYAEYLAKNSLWLHSNAPGLGENLAKSWSSQVTSLEDCGQFGTKYVKMWYDEIEFYDYSNPGQRYANTTEAIGHFTQVVWKASTDVGCGLAIGPDFYVYGVCNYSPPGNYIGAQNYQTNVLPLSRRRRRSVQDVSQSLTITEFSEFINFPSAFVYSTSGTPAVTSITPSSGSGGTITLAGSNFGTNSAEVIVRVGKTQCIITTVTDSVIVCELMAGPAGSHNVYLNINGVGDSNSDVEYTYALSLSGLSTSEGSMGGGLGLVLTGSGFSNSSTVTICGKACVLKDSTLTSLTCTVPKADVTDADSTCDVVLSENGQTETSSFTYRLALTPTVTGVSPFRGGTGGGTLLTITGTGFPNDENLVKVTIANVECIISAISATQIMCRTEPFTGSSMIVPVNVDILNNGLAFNDGSVMFEYIDLWSSRFTWGGMSPPGLGEIAVIGPNQHIYYDLATSPILKGIIIQGGSLIFDDNQDVNLNVEYVLIVSGGKLQVGTADRPFQHQANITMYGHLRSIELPIFGAKVIGVRNGTIDLHGKPVGVTWTHLGATAVSGSNTITLKEPVADWRIGSEIVIATTGDKFSPGESEKRTIISKSQDNTVLTLDTPLEFQHLGESRTVGSGSDTQTLEIRAEVGLLTRNIVFRGFNDDTWNRLKSAEACPDGFNPAEFATQTCFLGRYGPELGSDEFGGIIFIGGGENQPKDRETVIGRFSNVELTHVGQAFRLGRYPIHFHRNGDMPSSFVRECAIHQSFNRAVNIHATNYVTVERSFIYNIMGGAYFLEDGVEIGNTFRYNLAVFVKTSSSLLNEDVTPAAFWATNPNNTYIHNAVAGSTHFGWWYRILDHPEGPSFTTDYCPKNIPFGRHHNNSVHSTGRFGLWIFPGYTPTATGACNDNVPGTATFTDFTAYSNDKGGENVHSTNIQFKNFRLWDHFSAAIDTKIILGHSSPNTNLMDYFFDEVRGTSMLDSVIVGNSIDGQAAKGHGLILGWDRGELVKNAKFYNFPNTDKSALFATAIAGKCVVFCGGWTNEVSGLTFNNVMHRTAFRWNWDYVLKDLDGSLTGTSGSIVMAQDAFSDTNTNCRLDNLHKSGTVCVNTKSQIRFALNNFSPSYATLLNANNSMGATVESPKLGKRLTHKSGMMMHFEANQEYTIYFANMAPPTNMSYNGAYFGFLPGEYVIIKHPLSQKPDQLQISNGQLNDEYFEPLTPERNSNGDWYWDNTTRTVQYLLINKNRAPWADIDVKFSAIKCRYVGCKPPESPGFRAPITSRPDNALLWSKSSTWAQKYFIRSKRSAANGYPEDGDSIIIPDGEYVVVDTALPKLILLQIEGVLELDNGIDHHLEADLIFINGGQLIVGWENDPILTNVTIVLNGIKNELRFVLPNGLENIGGKGIGVYGGLDIHGKPRDVTWTKLNTTVNAGATQIGLVEPVDWQVGELITITTTSFVVDQTEAMTIAAVSDDRRTLTLTSGLVYDHLVIRETLDNGQYYDIAAGVGLLSRNVKIIASEYDKQQSDLFGFRIIVSDYSVVVNDFLAYYKGFARISNCEMERPAQFDRSAGDDSKYGILFSNLGEYNATRPSYVRKSSFHHGLGVAIGILSSMGIPIEDNVIHKTIDFGIRVEGYNNEIRRNMLTMNYWGATYLTKEADTDNTAWGSIDICEADSAIVEDNFIAGSERAGFHYRGDLCPGGSLGAGKVHSIKRNTIYGAGVGVAVRPDFAFTSLACIQMSDFVVYKSQYFGLYYQHTSELVVDRVTLIDNQIGVYQLILQPSPLTHQVTDKKYKVRNSLVIGRIQTDQCIYDTYPRNISDTKSTFKTFGAGSNKKGRIGLLWPTYIVAPNGMPFKPWSGIMSYNQIGGQMLVDNVTFAHFNESCGNRDAVFVNSIANDDGQHPVHTSNIKLYNVANDSKVFLHRPNLGKINPSDCVDMDCDGLKKNLLNDMDGTFLGSQGSVFSQSEFGWGSQQRGLGDFRIPMPMLSDANGNMIDPSQVYNHPGIVRDENLCTRKDAWQAWECHGLDYQMLIIESMDKETEDRRLSPVAILSDNGYLDLINGPQDHGWCFGYTCQKRISTFMALVAANKNYDVVLTSTPPEKLRFHILNSDANFKIGLSMFYSQAQRVDMYKDSSFVAPTNAYFQNGDMLVSEITSSNLPQLKPTYQNNSGDNLFHKAEMKFYFTADGASVFDLKIAPVLYVKFGLPPITPEEFFNEATIVGNFAMLLGVEPSKIRRVEIVRASRRRRSVGSSDNFVTIIIEDNANADLTDTSSVEAQKLEMQRLDAKISNLYVTGALQASAQALFNVTLSGLSVQAPASNKSAEPLSVVNDLKVETKASGCASQVPCGTQPRISVIDANGNVVTNIGSEEFPWVVVAKLTSRTFNTTELIFQTEANVVNGYATFTKLGISQVDSSFAISYNFKLPEGLNASSFDAKEKVTEPMSAGNPVLTCMQNSDKVIADENSDFSIEVAIIDKKSKQKVENISFNDYEWTAEVSLYSLGYYKASGSLTVVNSSVDFDVSTGIATFSNLQINKKGMYVVSINVLTTNGEYTLGCLSKTIRVKKAGANLPTYKADPTMSQLPPNYVFKFEGDYNSIEPEEIKANMYNYLLEYGVDSAGIEVYSGSVYTAIYADDTSSDLLNSITANGVSIDRNLVFSYATINDGVISNSETSSETSSETINKPETIAVIAVGAIVGGVIAGLVGVGVVLLILWGTKEFKRIKVKNLSVTPEPAQTAPESKGHLIKLYESMTNTTKNNYVDINSSDEPKPVIPRSIDF